MPRLPNSTAYHFSFCFLFRRNTILSDKLLGKFKVTREGIAEIGQRIAALGLSTAIIMEGGYNTDELGENVAAFLGNFG